MTQLTRLYVCSALVVCAVLVCACGGESPSAPTAPASGPTPASPTPPSSSVPVYYVYGLILDDTDSPIGGVEVSGFPATGGAAARTTTDPTGRYELHGTSRSNDTYISLKKSGHDDAGYYVKLKVDDSTERNLHLYQSVSIAAGESMAVVIKPDDPVCGFDLEYLCRAVHVRIPVEGTLTLDATPDNSAVSTWVGLEPLPISYSPTTHLTIPVLAGSDVAVDVLRWWNDQFGAQRFTLITHFEPK